jgi:5-methyltetrahydrofolate--homocysteine methyltransferase
MMMMEGAGFRIVDLGTDVPPEKFVEAVKTEHPDIVAMSALLTTTTRSIVATIKALEEAGLRDQVKVMIGGAPITQEFADKVGADGFAPDAGSAARKAKELVAA